MHFCDVVFDVCFTMYLEPFYTAEIYVAEIYVAEMVQS